MSEADRRHWDERHSQARAAVERPGPPPVFALVEHLFPTHGRALEIACGRGEAAVWLAGRGMEVGAVDVSPVAIDLARELAAAAGVGHRCHFDVFDLDYGLPPGPPVDLLLCHMFRDPRLYQPMVERLASGGLLAVAVWSEVDVGPGRFRSGPGELRGAFGELEIMADAEGDGMAWILARRPGSPK